MFKNIGAKIKRFVEIVYWIQVGITEIALFVWMIRSVVECLNSKYGSPYYAILMIIVFLVAMALTPFIVWIGFILLYGFGQLVDNSEQCKIELQNMNYIIEKHCEREINREKTKQSAKENITQPVPPPGQELADTIKIDISGFGDFV